MLPISYLYKGFIQIKNYLYHYQLIKSKTYDIPIIVVGNLTTGGSGKTPHTEKIIRYLIENENKCVVLSRGYGRTTRGYREVTISDQPHECGDEPLQIKMKFPDIHVLVDGNRNRAIERIISEYPETEVIVMDDGFQHRSVKPSFSILLVCENDIQDPPFLLPAGNLREPLTEAYRADIIVVTKNEKVLNPLEKRLLKEKIQSDSSQLVFFSQMKNRQLKSIHDHILPPHVDFKKSTKEPFDVILVTGIANAEPFKKFIASTFELKSHFSFPDHHVFTPSEMEKIIQSFHEISDNKKFIVTTEKDAMRFMEQNLRSICNDIPLFYIDVEPEFFPGDEELFKNAVLNHVRKDSRNSKIY